MSASFRLRCVLKQVEYFWKLIPNLRWAPKDFVVDGDKVTVRGVATGSPKGSFMGLELDGTKSFTIDTTDIHELAGDQIVRVHHLEDWATAIRQLSGPPVAAKLKVAHSVETATFQVKPGVTDVALLAVEARVRAGRISSWPGYLGRELAKDDATGEWLMVMRFERREQMDAWMSEVKGVPEMRELGALIEMKTMVTRFFTHAEP